MRTEKMGCYVQKGFRHLSRGMSVGWRENTLKRDHCDTGVNLTLKCICEGKHKIAGCTTAAMWALQFRPSKKSL